MLFRSGLRFAPDEFWKGETHRIIDRPGAVVRLCEELAAAGVSQVILVSAHTAVNQPHHVRPAGFDPRSRLGEYLETAETTALRDALEIGGLRFDACYVIAPAHNPLGPFDVDGVYDEASARRQSPQELIARGYEDAYHQFIDPVVGASGEHLAATIDRLVGSERGQDHGEGFVDQFDPRR